MQQTIFLAVFLALCALAMSQGQLRMMPWNPLPPPMVPGINLPLIPIIPSPWHRGGAWTSNTVFGSPLFPGGTASGQMWSASPFWGQQWNTFGQNGQRPISIQNGQWLSSGQNGLNSQWPVNGQNGQFLPNGLNGQLSLNGQNGQFSPNGLNGQLMDQSQVLPNSWTINGQPSNTFATTDTFGSGMSPANSDPWGMYKQLAMDSSLGTQSASRNQGALNQQTGVDNGFLSGSGQTGWTPIDGFRSANQNFNNGFTSPTAGSATNFG
ncbi:uncharacterized protein LOC127861369 [Dreissena polymorpha]|uniref:Uncharacterized protein n=1 Tax=Dreissena polymorpha TaxID=45954 RepID=A0A9D3YCN2_DREPO|nr:uncharacterized protein LOC127861369 [Dreissena polymorpha]KAH3698068.1 hypothetical protein DPMN_085584 [Dreissena polymorpha]